MSPNENGTEKHAWLGWVLDGLQLAALEAKEEVARWGGRLLVWGFVGAGAASAFILFQVAVVAALVQAGASLVWVCVAGGVLWTGLVTIVLMFVGHRTRRVIPFQSTKREMEATLQWIQKNLS